jgi:hypothetical protein
LLLLGDRVLELPGEAHQIFGNRLAFNALKNEREIVFRSQVLAMSRAARVLFES